MYVAIIHKGRVLEIAQSEAAYGEGIRAYTKLGYGGLRCLVTDLEAFEAFSEGVELVSTPRVRNGRQENYLKKVTQVSW